MKTQSEHLLRLPQVLQLYPISRSSWYFGIKEGRYPRPIKISARCAAWSLRDIEDLIASKGAQS